VTGLPRLPRVFVFADDVFATRFVRFVLTFFCSRSFCQQATLVCWLPLFPFSDCTIVLQTALTLPNQSKKSLFQRDPKS